MPMEFGPELMAIVGPDFFDPEWEFINHMIYKVDCIRLGVLFIDL